MNEDQSPPHTYDGFGPSSPRWWPSRYGASDERGAQNELSPQLTLAALRLPREGRVIGLAQTMDQSMPQDPPRLFHHVTLAHWSIEGPHITPSKSGLTAFEDQITLNSHSGCHIDGFGHNGICGRAYNGVHYRDFYTPHGLTKYGIERVEPWVTRGICLDIAALEATRVLPAGFVITPAHLDAACLQQKVEVQSGDVVILHTGWSRLWSDSPRTYFAAEPGLGWDGAHWLTDRHASAVAADNWALEALPAEDPERPFIVHQHLLTETGTYIFENITTQELAQSGRTEFLFIAAPIKVSGLTGSPVAPIAVI